MTPDQIRDLRRKFGMTQGQLATQLGVSVSTIHNAERGYNIRPHTLAALQRLSQTPMPVYPANFVPPPPPTPAFLVEPVADPAFAGDDDPLVLYTKAQQALTALYRAVKARQAGAAVDSPRGARLSPTEIAQRQVDTKLERRRLTEERIAAATVKWDEDAFAKVTDCAQRWPYLTRDETMIEIENIRNSPLGDHRRLLDFINVYIHTGRAADPRNPEDASIFTPTDRPYQPLAKLFLPPMPQ